MKLTLQVSEHPIERRIEGERLRGRAALDQAFFSWFFFSRQGPDHGDAITQSAYILCEKTGAHKRLLPK
jgi:hypothetical protein